MTTGTVIAFYDDRGWGIISANGRIIFVHFSQIISRLSHKSLLPGQTVNFDLYLDPKDHNRYVAKNVVSKE